METRIGHLISWLFGILALAIGFVNTFWGNDPFFGIFIMLCSLIYYLPIYGYIKKLTDITIPKFTKVLLAIFILWAALGVGELFDKIELMMTSFN
ncbi:hypothetical protein [Marivirga sp.]|uniref:hypothetical protein n=1 Tax=Marivirga sp. TaxID=2018662 RepID=UPI0025E63681|nr:hypothetical protein [Marivirga sp.]